MQHVTVGDKSLLIGDEVVGLLVDYATLLGQDGSADSVELHAISSDGDAVMVTFLLNAGLSIVSESTSTSMPEPDNGKAESYLRTEIGRITRSRTASAEELLGVDVWGSEEAD
jgi:hypothetical protein